MQARLSAESQPGTLWIMDRVRLTEAELREFAKANMTGYKAPKFYEFRDELPKSNVGKILRKELRGK